MYLRENQEKKIGESVSICPHCKRVWDRQTQDHEKCPYCNNFIYVCSLPIIKKVIFEFEERFEEIELNLFNFRDWFVDLTKHEECINSLQFAEILGCSELDIESWDKTVPIFPNKIYGKYYIENIINFLDYLPTDLLIYLEHFSNWTKLECC